MKKMKAGKYYIGDLCYVMTPMQWEEVCSLIFPDNDCHTVLDGVFTLSDGTEFAIFSTKYGDGTYYDQEDNEYGVDSGSIGCALAAHFVIPGHGGYIVREISHDFVPTGRDGKINIGGTKIDTGDYTVFDE